MGLLSDRINNKLERTNLIIEHAFNRESVPLSASEVIRGRGSCVCITMRAIQKA